MSLYSEDYALDLKSSISGLIQLPFDSNRLLEILCEIESDTALDENDEDYTTFWLVTADQFLKKGILCAELKEKALEIIEEGKDLEMMEELGMSPKDLKKRSAILDDIRTRLNNPLEKKERKTLSKPQPYLMDVGDCFIFPTSKGTNINPYVSDKDRQKYQELYQWVQDGYGIFTILERGKAFDYLSWYRPLIIKRNLKDKPSSQTILPVLFSSEWHLGNPGTLSPIHFKRLELEKVTTLAINERKLHSLFPKRYPGTSFAVENIEIQLDVTNRSVDLKNIKNILI